MAAYFISPASFPGVYIEAANPQAAVAEYLALETTDPVADGTVFAVSELPAFVLAHVGVTLENTSAPTLPTEGT